jgi:hypothetical protein
MSEYRSARLSAYATPKMSDAAYKMLRILSRRRKLRHEYPAP